VLAGAGSNDTRVAIANVHAAKAAGADAALMVPPYTTPEPGRPSSGISRHPRETPLPIVLYNVPGRTVTDIQSRRCAIVKAFPDVFIGVKDATGSLGRVTSNDWLRAGLSSSCRAMTKTALAFNAMGGIGCISVTANVAPRLCADFQAAWAAGDQAKRWHYTTDSIRCTSRCHRRLAGAVNTRWSRSSPMADGATPADDRGRRSEPRRVDARCGTAGL